ncbi:MAG: NAD(P)/FAD-dependent oxidoreductase [Alphaproteobacteria bacterium]|nr:MAG: NAD(P)/FAD-dependent oxidoreductase [Alphaproteobacteria bacterium]
MDMSLRQRLVVVGNGMAGMRTVEELLARAPGLWQVTVFGAEPRPNYNRILLSPLLAGEKSFDQIVINDLTWYRDHGVTLHANDPVIAIDRDRRTVTTASGMVQAYDALLLATGSNPILLPLPGRDLPGVVTFRDADDVTRMTEAATAGGEAVVIGGGLLGLEAAYGLAKLGMGVTVIHLVDRLMERQLDHAAADLLRQELERRGIRIRLSTQTNAILGTDQVTGVELATGEVLPARLVVMTVGIRPNASLAASAGLTVERGVVVADTMATSDPAIFAVGECAQHRGVCYGLVAPLWDMARTIADQLVGRAEAVYTGSQLATRLKVTGVEVFSAGAFDGRDGTEAILLTDPARNRYRKLVLEGDRLVGAVLYGDAADGDWYFSLIKAGTPLGAMRDLLVFGEAIATGGSDASPTAAVAALPDDAEICGCNGVTKGHILAAIAKHQLTTLDDVKAYTKAASGCGGCAARVEQVLALAIGEAAAAPAEKPLCKCTDHGHDHVRAAIREQGLTSISQVMRALDWKTDDGCATCRPALNFYLLIAWPGIYRDDPQSRFINERAHANIQKDGTFSVVPRMWGGVTTAAELRAIADVVDRYEIPEVKVTGGQRIDLFGVKKEDLPAVWADLNAAGMVSGHAYGKALRTVKTCVGSTWCRFGTQDSTSMGIALERMTWGSWHPHKVKLAVSGCPRNCAEATIKDFGVVAVDSGWELHIGGNGGIHVRATDFLCKVTTDDEVLEYCAAFLQLYREEARYLERTAPWVVRVGLAYVKARIVEDPAGRAELAARFRHAQTFAQVDPWAEIIAGRNAAEFRSLDPVEA